MSNDSTDWAARYRGADTPWDLGAAHPELQARVRELAKFREASGGRALVAGCGRGHDALCLAEAGWRVTALDIVDATAGDLGRRLSQLGGTFRVEDALGAGNGEKFDLVFEHTFFCAIDPALRPRWGASMGRALTQGGALCALVFPVGKPAADGGPPFGNSTADMLAALGSGFVARLDQVVTHGVARRSWPERWVEFARAD